MNLELLCRHHHNVKHAPGVTVTGTAHDFTIHLTNGTTVRCALDTASTPQARPRTQAAA